MSILRIMMVFKSYSIRIQKREFYFLTKYGEKPHTSFDYSDRSADIFFVFGKETTGLPDEVLKENKERCLRIPMNDHIRSLNLSNTAAILIYEALRQQSLSRFGIKKWDCLMASPVFSMLADGRFLTFV